MSIPSEARLVIYGKPGCHLCDDARTIIDRVCTEVGTSYDEVDITTEDRLHAAYLERIPVVTLDGEERFELFVDEAALRDLLSKVRPG
ncbi:MAG TPA: glutaredoxin family protein [Solirubrobacteraceae bacterium]|nr:glutaredoxin family protein [Solirubrobacteraceae bacterium]